ncbi:MAG: universal stress protein, partial [Anaerolineales bacterium]|nr:universal stress protein [Anaerolineales bacterium]
DAEAVVGWYDNVYMPVILLIREQGILHNFPERTEADLYVLLSERREEIETALGWQIDAKTAVVNLAPAFDRAPQNMLSRLGGRLMEVVAPGLEDGPPVGFWREQREALHRADVLFDDILVSLQGTEADWHLLDGVIEVAKRENGRLLAINAVASEAELSDPRVEEIEAGFQQRCQASGVQGEFAAEVGVEGEIMIRRAAWVDLVATNLTFATELKPRLPLSSGVDMLIQQCPRPILVLPGVFESPMDRALLGYDGSPKAREALYVAAYLASCWQLHLDVVTVETDFTSSAALDEARQYLTSCGVENVNYLMRSHPIADALLETAVSRESNLLIVGGFGFRPVRYMMVGSTVDRALREFKQPILICR